jgi:hypothetical protein
MDLGRSPKRCRNGSFGTFRGAPHGHPMVAQRFIRQFLELDFSHLSQTGWSAHRPSTQRKAISSWLHTPLSDVGNQARSSAPKEAILRLLG